MSKNTLQRLKYLFEEMVMADASGDDARVQEIIFEQGEILEDLPAPERYEHTLYMTSMMIDTDMAYLDDYITKHSNSTDPTVKLDFMDQELEKISRISEDRHTATFKPPRLH